jgi:hypothetical protein
MRHLAGAVMMRQPYNMGLGGLPMVLVDWAHSLTRRETDEMEPAWLVEWTIAYLKPRQKEGKICL